MPPKRSLCISTLQAPQHKKFKVSSPSTEQRPTAATCHSRRYFLIIASQDHISSAHTQSIVQANHGFKAPIQRMHPGDGVVFYAPRMALAKNSPICRCFTALATISEGTVYQESVSKTFVPWRRKAVFVPKGEVRHVPISEVLARLKALNYGRGSYGMLLRRGFLEIGSEDWDVLWQTMVGSHEVEQEGSRRVRSSVAV